MSTESAKKFGRYNTSTDLSKGMARDILSKMQALEVAFILRGKNYQCQQKTHHEKYQKN